MTELKKSLAKSVATSDKRGIVKATENEKNSQDDHDHNDHDGEPTEEDQGDDDIYEVERVVGHKRDKNNNLYYHLKWKGYDSSDNTWEVETRVYCEELVERYWVRYEANGGHRTDLIGKEPGKEKKKMDDKVGKMTTTTPPSPPPPGSVSPTNSTSTCSLLPNVPELPMGEVLFSRVAQSTTGREFGKRSVSGSGTTVEKKFKLDREQYESTDQQGCSLSNTVSSRVKDQGAEQSWRPSKEWTDWTEYVYKVIDVEMRNEKVVVHLQWRNGKVTKHFSPKVHKKCPTVLLQYYEKHLKLAQAQN